VATKLIAQTTSPNYSAIVTPKPIDDPSNLLTNREHEYETHAKNRETQHQIRQHIETEIETSIRNNQIRNQRGISNRNAIDRIKDTEYQNNNKNRQYLISHFFQKSNSSRRELSTTLETDSITTTGNNNDTIITHDTTLRNNVRNVNELNNSSTLNDTNTEPTQVVNNNINTSAATQRLKTKKHYIQQHLSKKPIPNDYWGSSMDTHDKNCFRIFFQNINGLTSGESLEKWKEIVTTMQDKNCNIFGLAETNTNWNYINIRTHISSIINKQIPNSNINLSKNRFNPTDNSRYQPGGTLQSCTGYWSSRIIAQINDPRQMGRWSGQTFRLKAAKTLSVITAYRPCKKNNTNNKSTSMATYRQQTVMLTEEGYSNPDPRKIFIQDITKTITELEQCANNYIVLMLDANENINDSEGGIRSLLRDTTLIDTFSHIGNLECELPTYIRGSRKIDYIFTSHSLLPYIKNVGCIPFYMYNNSDHRGMFIDIEEKLIDNKIELQKPNKRNIGTQSTGLDIYNYKKYIDEQFREHKIYGKTQQLQQLIIYESKERVEHIINNLDKFITTTMLRAEKKCCRTRHENDWSVELHVTSLMCKYWLKIIKGHKNNVDINSQANLIYMKLPPNLQNNIDKLKRDLSRNEIFRISIRELRKQINNKKYLITYHKELRKRGLEVLREQRLANGEIIESEIIKKIANTEMKKHDWEKIRNTFNPRSRSGISNIEIPFKDANGDNTSNPEAAISWTRITDPTNIKNKLIERNILNFGQAEGSLFTREDIKQSFTYEGTSSSARSLIEGEFDIHQFHNMTNGATTLFTKLNNRKNLSTFDNNISFLEFKKAFSKWNENTSTSPSGRHLGHYKCLLRSDQCELLYDETNIDPKEKIMQVYYDIVNTAIHLGISLQRWQHSTTMMIEKIPGCPKINKLRVIHLYEADYNIVLKIIWARKLVWHAHDQDRLHDGQAGSRPGRNAIDVVIQKEMKYLYSRLTKTNLATMDNDAKSCYDRIICNLAMIISQYYGISRNVASVQANTLKSMKFRLRTALGDSKRTYQHSNKTPIHGTGQGSCASPAIWLLISSILMECLSETGGGMTMINVNTKSSIRQWIDGFVDDTSIFTNILHNKMDDTLNFKIIVQTIQ
jgi:hypothetical protein